MRTAVVFCVHHKPWLIMSSLISVLAQTYAERDIFFIYQEGDEAKFKKMREGDLYRQYYELVNQYGQNSHLDPYDPRVAEVCRLNGLAVNELRYDNDHALDSGAWYKFIRSGRWRDYDYVLFLGEGALLTCETVLEDTVNFASQNKVHFITGAQEKRKMPKDLFLEKVCSKNEPGNKMLSFHDEMIAKVFEVFSRDSEFKKVMDSWSKGGGVITENHVPDIWGVKGIWQRLLGLFYPNFAKGKPPRFNLAWLGRLFDWYNYLTAKISVLLNLKPKQPEPGHIYVNAVRRKLSDVVAWRRQGAVKFHTEAEPGWFGCCCNHFVSRDLLEQLARKLEEHQMYDFLKIPYAGSALEVIWGLVPAWLGREKWFFNGIHRVRKNFVNYRREDDAAGMARYLNRYFSGRLSVIARGEYIKLAGTNTQNSFLRKTLNEHYAV